MFQRAITGVALLVVLVAAVAADSARSGLLRAPAASGPPRLVYSMPGSTDQRRLAGSVVGDDLLVGFSRESAIRSVAFSVDEPKGSKRIFAVDRSAPFVLPRGGKARHPYRLGPHTLSADVELRTGRHTRLRVEYTVARTMNVGETVDPETFMRSIASLAPGLVLVRPARGLTAFSVTGNVVLDRPELVIDRGRFAGLIEFGSKATGATLLNSSALGFNVFGADDIRLVGNTFDGQARVSSNQLWDAPAGNTPDGFVIRGNTFKNYYVAGDPLSHSEALFVGYSTNGLIEGNTFTNNGTTSHIFFSWFGNQANPATSYPRNMCIRANRFNDTAGAYVDVNFREEIPANARIVVQRDASSSNPAFWGSC